MRSDRIHNNKVSTFALVASESRLEDSPWFEPLQMISNGEQLNIVSQSRFIEERESVIGGRRNVTLIRPERNERSEVAIQWEEIMKLVSSKEYIDEVTGKTRFRDIVHSKYTRADWDIILEKYKPETRHQLVDAMIREFGADGLIYAAHDYGWYYAGFFDKNDAGRNKYEYNYNDCIQWFKDNDMIGKTRGEVSDVKSRDNQSVIKGEGKRILKFYNQHLKSENYRDVLAPITRPKSTTPDIIQLKDGQFVKKWKSSELERHPDYNRPAIQFVLKGKTKTSGGFGWKYAE